ncbi:formate/nitrite transporter family protein [Planosporangium mesophilum]|uniref:Putative transporter YrhG n=1 Tax=Planosporangium mesophilum TaxID=689768 RepID=A0A8J3T9K9_9ACTN|nr:formate/nitrite transporter family protein [Planosporangium mesophilum]NJC81234.1 formate/nitrite transporter family protein [Planosporangium mesophilum]GII21116.1 putative transporter YrhG [Planosporangium mesophilum]
MSFKTPDQIATAAVNAGVAKANLTPDRMLAGGILAGAYIGFAGLLSVVVTAGLKTEAWGNLPTLIFGAVFATGLILVVIAGAELVTGNMALLPLALTSRRVRVGRAAMSLVIVTVGNLIGALLVAYLLAVKTGVIGSAHSAAGTAGALTFAKLAAVAKGKAVAENGLQIFLRAIGCNWLVCLAVWMAYAAEDIAGKILAIFFPIMAFVALGFDHVVANMFFLPAAMFAHVPGVSGGEVVHNLVLAFLGNAVGGGLFVAGFYWFLYLRGRPRVTTPEGVEVTPASEARSEAGAHAAGPR